MLFCNGSSGICSVCFFTKNLEYLNAWYERGQETLFPGKILHVLFDSFYFGIDFFFIFCSPVAHLLQIMKGVPYCHEKLSKRVVV